MKRMYLVYFYCFIFSISFSQKPVPVHSVQSHLITVLPANDAVLGEGLKPARFQDLEKDPKVFAVQGWKNKTQSFTWKMNVAKKDNYKVAVLLLVKGLSANAVATMQLSAGTEQIRLQTTNTGWDKIYFPAVLSLGTGSNSLQLTLIDIPAGEQPEMSIYSIEIATEKEWQRHDAAVQKLRSKPQWLTDAGYGLFFHWNARSKPRSGEPKNYIDAVHDFDVVKFAAMVHETGADFIILTTSWSLQTFPAPLKTLDSLLPGNTAPRDLIADLASALSKWDIKLMVYCNFRINRIGWKNEDKLVPGKTEGYISAIMSIYKEIGFRYAKKIGGLWIDDGMGLYPYNAPFEELITAIKQKDKEMVIGFNSWIYPRFTDFQDFYGGEMGITLEAAGVNNKHLPVGGNGYFTAGPQQGLKATFCGLMEPGDWTHTELNTEIPPPLLKPEELIKIVQEAMQRKNTAVMNIRVYQDGTISPQTFNLLLQLKQAVHK